MAEPVDFRAFQGHPSDDDLVEFIAEHRRPRRAARGRAATDAWTDRAPEHGVPAGRAIASFAIAGGVILIAFGIPLTFVSAGLALVVHAVAVAPVAFGLAILHRYPWQRRVGYSWTTLFRLTRFAWDNGFTVEPSPHRPNYPGQLFRWKSRTVDIHVSGRRERFFDIGNVSNTLGTSSGAPILDDFGFIAVHLDRRLPHIFLDAKANNGVFGGMGMSFTGHSTISLEGDFHAHFTLYAPAGYDADTLYILTPDLMALLIDQAGVLDVEIIDDWFLAYSRTPFDLTSEESWRRLLEIVDTVGARTARRSRAYSDVRVPSVLRGTIAAGGRRLSWLPFRPIVLTLAGVAGPFLLIDLLVILSGLLPR